MAGDWIKMRSNLWDDPRIAKICDLTNTQEATVVGGLYWLWATADQHSEDGVLLGLTIRSVDRKTGIPGFGDALLSAGWLADHHDGVQIVRFSEHNGKSAKRRCSESVRKMSARDADKCQTESGRTEEVPEESCGQVAETPQQSCAPREREEKEKSKPKADALATRLPADWLPDDSCVEFCKAERPDLQPEVVAASFRDYWIAKPGKDGRKTDWPATWRNWVRRQNPVKHATTAAAPAGWTPPKPGDTRIRDGRKEQFWESTGWGLTA